MAARVLSPFATYARADDLHALMIAMADEGQWQLAANNAGFAQQFAAQLYFIQRTTSRSQLAAALRALHQEQQAALITAVRKAQVETKGKQNAMRLSGIGVSPDSVR